MHYKKGLSFGPFLAVLALSAVNANAAPGPKTPKECNSELYARLAAINAAGETASQFVHDCWWHSQAGQPTAIAHPGPAPVAAPREAEHQVEAPPRDVRTSELRVPVARPHRHRSRIDVAGRIVRAHRTAEVLLAERQRRRLARIARASRSRIALSTLARERSAGNRSRKEHRGILWDVAGNEASGRSSQLRRARAPRLARQDALKRSTAQLASRVTPGGEDTIAAAAKLGPSARLGRRMWVRVVAAGEVDIKPAVAVGGLADQATNAAALNCWGQPVMFVGKGGKRWSREMVCDGKPAGSNEWSAQIYYGGSSTR